MDNTEEAACSEGSNKKGYNGLIQKPEIEQKY